ncbi:hypothetical protein GOBAR_AA04911 [Gossypium barbadense]|uniref:Uncharacterized protein n=1 Tax=Gossypium barbadense TaxID=3634 RepID=A0A2P5YJB4_GOSBA|nr:hypothetical protein GOBAR_AA04911 [Gossypium barbadense]
MQDEEGLVAPEPESRQETVVSKGKGEVDHNDQKQMPNAVKFLKELLANKRKLDEAAHVEMNVVCSAILENKLGELTLHVGDDTITLQARNSRNTSKIEGDCINHTTNTDHVMQPSLQETRSKSTHEPCSSNNKEPIYEERRLQIEELDEWRTHKPMTHDKPKPRHDELNIPPNQLKVGDKALLDTTDPHIATSKSNGEIPLTILNIFPYGIVEVIHPKFSTFKVKNTRLKPYFDKIDSRDEECKLMNHHDYTKSR